MNRREFLRRMVAASTLMAIGVLSSLELAQSFESPAATTTTQAVSSQQTVTVTEYASGSSTSGSSQAAQSSSSGQPPAGYLLVSALSSLAGKSSAYFNHPTQGLSLLVNIAGGWKAFSATCTHAPCTVQFGGSTIDCPCHGGTFDPNNGNVLGGPPPSPLPELQLLVQGGNLYVAA